MTRGSTSKMMEDSSIGRVIVPGQTQEIHKITARCPPLATAKTVQLFEP